MRILFIVASGFFPYGLAISTRVVNYLRLFSDCGYEVHIISDYTTEPLAYVAEIKSFESGTYQAVTHVSSHKKLKRSARVFNPQQSLKFAKNYINNNKVDVVITSTCSDRFLKLKKLCAKQGIPLILDITEWYDVSCVKYGSLNPFYWNYTRRMEKDFKTADKFITISTLLQNHFASTGKEVLRLPTILDTRRMPAFLKTTNDKIIIVYAGFSGKGKESFTEILEALNLLGKQREKVEVHVYGCSKTVFLNRLGEKSSLFAQVQDTIIVKGRVPQTQVHEVFGNSDYSIFMRPVKQSNEAGFPTKLAESLTAGTPVICNKTGDIGLYLKNGLNGFLLEDLSAEALKNIFEEIIIMPSDKRLEMRKKARLTAENSFDYRNYIEQVTEFFLSYEQK